jgi:acyl-CoA reductase-like NAD-dependent aldehyde dehydrogenase
VIFGGECDDSVGWFVQPTVIEAQDPRYDTMCTELFGPVLTIHVYDDSALRGDARAAAHDVRVRAHRRRVRDDRGAIARRRRAAFRGRQLLRQRQADRARSSASSRSAAR